MRVETRWRLSLLASILTALGAQLHGVPEPWNHVVNIAGITGTAISGWVLQSPRRRSSFQRRFVD